ncbi:hypothetical protein KL86DES1_10098 [uncultured Desulfovibrio sp.]|uniref:DUF4875 domain-containing protein n=2 Tax=Desulfovibrio TaxID=872 RepID=A0A212KXF4_9BACT|nr:hypothetical protein KL86DES1_10098 [uncultured Desulfovibrio sp.]VZH35311.1 conserved protein of unknown function [Desulfovibrio sp. 86]
MGALFYAPQPHAPDFTFRIAKNLCCDKVAVDCGSTDREGHAMKKSCGFLVLFILFAFQADANAANMEDRVAAAGAAMALDAAGKSALTPPPAEAAPSWDVAKAKSLPYAVYDAKRDHRATTGRTKLNLRIILASKNAKGQIIPLEDTSTVTKEQLAATVIAAAKYYAKAAGVQFVGVALDSQFGAGVATTQLAVADYAPDGKGVSGNDNWTWQQVKAAENGLTKQELTMQELWGKWRSQYQTPQGITDEAALSAAIGSKLGIAPSEVSTAYKPLFDVPESFVDTVQPAPGLTPKQK